MTRTIISYNYIRIIAYNNIKLGFQLLSGRELMNNYIKLVLVAGTLSFGVATQAVAANIDGPSIFWKFSMWGKPRALSTGMEHMIKRVATETGGKFKMKIFYGGQLSKSKENLDGLKLNAFEGAAICNFYHPGKNPALMVLSLPFLPLGDPKVDKYVRGKIMEHPAIVADMAKWNAMPYVSGLLPQYEILGKGKPPEKLSDWKGMRVRAGGGLGSAMQRLGAIKTTLPAGETSTAFSRGAVDAAAFPFTYAHVSFKISDEATWFTSNLTPGTSECAWLFNKTAFSKLPPQYKKLLLGMRSEVMDKQLAAYAAADKKNLPVFKKKMKEIRYDAATLKRFHTIAGKPVWDAWIAKNQKKFDAQGLFDSIWKYAAEAKK
jgi:TRAP-type mannitol/chloroaromatic compound transport system substrate-binding protein